MKLVCMSDGKKHAVYPEGYGAMPISMLEREYSHIVVAWCSSREVALKLQQWWNENEATAQ